MFKIKQNLFCNNCGKKNHKYANCNEPITSYGVICYYKNNILLVRRKFSFSFIGFIMGKYDMQDIQYLALLFSRMSKKELMLIIELMDFDKLRNIIGLNNFTRAHKNEYDNSKIKFTYIKNMNIILEVFNIIDNIFHENFLAKWKELNNIKTMNEFIIQKDLLNKIKKDIQHKELYNEPEWEIPKGKRNDQETNLSTAIREFNEETSIDNVNIFKNIIPLEEEFTAINNVKYKHIYYLGIMDNLYFENITNNENKDIILPLDCNNLNQKKEIGAVMLSSINNVEKYLRYYQINKKKVIYKSYQIINNYKLYFY